MSESLQSIVSNTDAIMKKAISHLETELVKIRAGKANPQIVDGIQVDYYGNQTPLNQIANISVLDSRTLAIQPWEKNMIQPIEKAIMVANIGITPQNDGNSIKLFLPPLTEERRKELVKRSHAEGEHAKVSIRNARRDAMEQVKKTQKRDALSEDAIKDTEKNIQEITDKFIVLIDKHIATKEKEVMVV